MGSVALDPGSILAIELAGSGGVAGTDFDQLAVTGNATLAGVLDVSLINPFTLSPGLSFEIIDVGGTLAGTFSGLSQGAFVGNFSGTNLFIDYTAGDGNDVALISAIDGDYDFDGDVDGSDFLKWQRGASPNPLSASDLADWEASYGSSAPLSTISTTVPEPASAMLCVIAAGILGSCGRRSRFAT